MAKQRKEKDKKKKYIKRRILLILFLIVIICGIFVAKRVKDLEGNWLALLMGHTKNTIKNLEELKILIMGESTGMSDTIIVAQYNPKLQKASLLSIPRDTFTGEKKSQARSYHKINSLYSNGETPERTVQAVNKITDLDIKNYILIDTKALRELVDLIDGIQFDVPVDMDYDDGSQDLHIHFTKGYQKLNGKQVEEVARFRHNNNGSTYPYKYGMEDYGRMKTQRNLIIAVAKQTIRIKNVKEIGNIIDIMKKNVKSNINFDVIKDYIPYAIKLDLDTIETEQLPGKSEKVNGTWLFFHDKEKTLEVVDKLFNMTEPEENQIANEIVD